MALFSYKIFEIEQDKSKLREYKATATEDVRQAYEHALEGDPGNAALYAEYAVVLAVFGFYELYMADRYAAGQPRLQTYQRIAQKDPYLVLNHAVTGEQWYYAGLALSADDAMSEQAKYALKTAAATATDSSIKEMAEKILKNKYRIN